jgi:LytR cell envelope-related transcriptional attenuator
LIIYSQRVKIVSISPRDHVRKPFIAVVACLVAVLTGCGPSAEHIAGPSSTDASAEPSTTLPAVCPSGLVVAQVWPPERRTVRVRILDSSGRPGIAAQVSAQFREGGPQVVDSGQESVRYDGLVILRYGPRAVGAAWDMIPFFVDTYPADSRWRDEFQLDRGDDVVDVILGAAFDHVKTITEVSQTTAKLPLPKAPAGTCAAPHR